MAKLSNTSDIYSRKALWKRVLVIAALIIVGVSFFYSSRLVNKLSQEERIKVRLWADAIETKANTVNNTAKLFVALADAEKQKIELWAKATKVLSSTAGSSSGSANNGFVLLAVDIIGANNTIPIIQTDQSGRITSSRNVIGLIDTLQLQGEELQIASKKNKELLDSILQIMIKNGNRIDVNYIGDEYIYLYYKDSRILEELRSTFAYIQESFVNDIISMAASTPVIYVRGDSVVAYNMVDTAIISDTALLKDELVSMSFDNEPIKVDLGNDEINYVYFSDSDVLKKLKYFSTVQSIVLLLFVLIGYWLFSIFKRSEQNKVWVGMAKETAHQLGTPLSALMGWMDVLRLKKVDEGIIVEMEKDVERLEMITDRFSKIGATPKLKTANVYDSLEKFVKYFRTRSPRKVEIELVHLEEGYVISPINEPLFHWVIENLCKNAIDAMEGKGKITIVVMQEAKKTVIDITDNGNGIPFNKRSTVFQPGFTSKERGWGLGLSLSKRIIKDYHNGSINVRWSEQGKGTTFRIELKQ